LYTSKTNNPNTQKNPDELLRCKRQVTGDCPKASLLGALHYHSWEKNGGNSKPYKQFLHKVKMRALERDGHLLDIGLCYPKKDEPLAEVARKRLETSAAKLASAI